MAQRGSRKRRGQQPARAAGEATTPLAPDPRGDDAGADDARAERPSRSEQRDAEARASLEPLAEGERPAAVTVAALVAVAIAALSVLGYAFGARFGSLGGVLVITALMLVAAWGMWRVRYWAVLGFQALLAFQILFAAISLAVASNWWAVVLCLAIVLLGGWLFWKLIRAMARIQMLERERRGP